MVLRVVCVAAKRLGSSSSRRALSRPPAIFFYHGWLGGGASIMPCKLKFGVVLSVRAKTHANTDRKSIDAVMLGACIRLFEMFFCYT